MIFARRVVATNTRRSMDDGGLKPTLQLIRRKGATSRAGFNRFLDCARNDKLGARNDKLGARNDKLGARNDKSGARNDKSGVMNKNERDLRLC